MIVGCQTKKGLAVSSEASENAWADFLQRMRSQTPPEQVR
jgi:hypothetical protein